MKVVIAGGSGLVGRHLSALLLADGWTVDVLTRDPKTGRDQTPRGARDVAWNSTADGALRQALDGADAVVNLAGEALGPRPWTPGRKRSLLESRLRATNALVDSIAALPVERRPKVLVRASGTDVYTGRDAAPADETTEPTDDFLARLCIQWETAAGRADALGVRVVLVRTAFVLARDAPVLRLLALPFRLFVGGRLGSGRQWFSWIHVDDLARIYRLGIVDGALNGPVNAAAPEPILQRDLARAIGRRLHRPSRFSVPAWLIRLVLWGQATLVLGSRRAVPARALAAGYVFLYPDLDEALAEVL
jgi:uncharacterized protein (TIGR01777 family)